MSSRRRRSSRACSSDSASRFESAELTSRLYSGPKRSCSRLLLRRASACQATTPTTATIAIATTTQTHAATTYLLISDKARPQVASGAQDKRADGRERYGAGRWFHDLSRRAPIRKRRGKRGPDGRTCGRAQGLVEEDRKSVV